MQRLIAHVKASGAKLVLVGDVNQLQAIEAGGAFKALQDYSGAGHAALKENVRQKTAEMRAVVAHTLRGEAAKALEILEQKGLVEIRKTGMRRPRRPWGAGWIATIPIGLRKASCWPPPAVPWSSLMT